MDLNTWPGLLFSLILLLSFGTLISGRSLATDDINGKLLETVKSFMNPKENPCENFYHYACGNWEHASEDNSNLVDNISSLDQAFNQKILEILKARNESQKLETDVIYGKVRDYYETCQQGNNVDVAKYMDIIKPTDGEEWPLSTGPWSPKTQWNVWATLGKLAAFGFKGLFFNVQADTHNATTDHIIIDQYESVDEEFESAVRMCFDDYTAYECQLGNRILDFIQKLLELHYEEKESPISNRDMTLNDLQKQVKDIDFFAYFEGFLGKGDLGQIQVVVQNLTYLQQLAELVKNTPQEILMHSLQISFLNYLEYQKIFAKLPSGCIAQMRNLFPMALNYMYDKEMYQRNSTDVIIEKVFHRMQQKLVEIFEENRNDLSNKELAYVKEKILKMKLNIGNLPQGVDEKFYTDYLNEWQVIKGDYLRSLLSALHHRATQDFASTRLRSPSPLNTFLVLSGGSPYYTPISNYLIIPFAYLNYPAFQPGFKDVFLFAELGNTMGHEIMHAFDTIGILRDVDGTPSKIFDTTNKPNYTKGLECLRKTKTFSLTEKLADFSGFRLAYDTYFQQSMIPKYTAGESVLTTKQLFFIKFAQFFCAIDESSISYDKSHDTPFRRVPEVVANHPEFEEVFSCPRKTGEALVEKCKLW